MLFFFNNLSGKHVLCTVTSNLIPLSESECSYYICFARMLSVFLEILPQGSVNFHNFLTKWWDSDILTEQAGIWVIFPFGCRAWQLQMPFLNTQWHCISSSMMIHWWLGKTVGWGALTAYIYCCLWREALKCHLTYLSDNQIIKAVATTRVFFDRATWGHQPQVAPTVTAVHFNSIWFSAAQTWKPLRLVRCCLETNQLTSHYYCDNYFLTDQSYDCSFNYLSLSSSYLLIWWYYKRCTACRAVTLQWLLNLKTIALVSLYSV